MHHIVSMEVQNQEKSQTSFIPANSKARISKNVDFHSALNQSVQKGKAINISHKEIMKILVSSIKELLDLALMTSHHHGVDSSTSKKAFTLLSTGPVFLIDALLNNFVFFLKATEILTNDNIPGYIAERLAIIFSNIIVKSEESSIDSIGFLILLLKHIEEPAVFSLFHTIFTKSKDQLKSMQVMISQTDIDVFVINEFDFNSSFEKQHNLLLLIQDCLKNNNLKSNFQNKRVLTLLVNLMNRYEVFNYNAANSFECENLYNNNIILNQLWQTIALFSSNKTITKMQPMLNKAMEILIEPFMTLHIYHTAIFDFLGNLVDLKANMFNEEQRNQICQIILRLLVQYPESTNIITSIFRFIRNSLHSREFANKMLNSFVTLFIFEAQSETRTSVSASAMLFLGDVEKMKTTSVMINKILTSNPHYLEFYRNFFKRYLEELNEPYGGAMVTRYVSAKKGKGYDSVSYALLEMDD